MYEQIILAAAMSDEERIFKLEKEVKALRQRDADYVGLRGRVIASEALLATNQNNLEALGHFLKGPPTNMRQNHKILSCDDS